MAKVSFSSTGDLSETKGFLKRITRTDIGHKLKRYGEEGVEKLRLTTPVDTGRTASSWTYGIEDTKDSVTLYFENDNIHRGISIVKLIEEGHASRGGTWVPGHPFVKTATEPILINAEADIWKEVTD